MLELKNICYTVSTPETGEQTILKDISVTIPDGFSVNSSRVWTTE